ncbi:MAG: hypothetical protein GYA21_18810 [Myxococcales bacterium]|nr:hypothetical protein [Myxococcales bacterium]
MKPMMAIAWVLSASMLAGCGEEGGRIALRLNVTRLPLDSRGGAPAARGQPPPDIQGFRLCVQDTNGEPLTCKDFADLSAEKFRLGDIPTGDHLVVTFQGYRPNPLTGVPEVLWCGRAVDVPVRKNSTTAVSLLLSRCGDSTETPGGLGRPRVFHTATRLADGRILIAGGFSSFSEGSCPEPCTELVAEASLEVYDPGTGEFSATGNLASARGLHAAHLLPDGRVALAGGCLRASLQSTFSDPDRPGSPLRCLEGGPASRSYEVFDPVSGLSDAHDMPETMLAGAAGLPDGRLLLLGGLENGSPSRRGLLIDPASGETFPLEDLLSQARVLPAVVPLGGAPFEVFVVGGAEPSDYQNAGIWAERIWVTGNQANSAVPAFVTANPTGGFPVLHAGAGLWWPGRVILSGGMYSSAFGTPDRPFVPTPLKRSAMIDLRLDQLSVLSESAEMIDARAFHTVTQVSMEGLLVAGGFQYRDPQVPARFQGSAFLEWWDGPNLSFGPRWALGQRVVLARARAGHSATRLLDGRVLLVGGLGSQGPLASAEVFDPFPNELGTGGLPALLPLP